VLACTVTSEREVVPPPLPPTDKRSATLTPPSAATGASVEAAAATEAADLPDEVSDSVASSESPSFEAGRESCDMTDDALEEGGSAPPSKVRGFSFLPLSFFFFFLVLFSSGPSLGLASSSIMSSYAALSARSLALRSSFATARRRFSSSSLCALVAPWWYAGIGREFVAAGFPLRLVAAAAAREG
jgi:hypothetical protein